MVSMVRSTLRFAELVSDLLAGDREAFGELYDRYARVVRAVVLAVTGDWPAVDDMTQESFLRGYRKIATLRDAARFGPWIAGIARQVARERRRTLRRDRHEFAPQPPESAATEAEPTDREQLTRVMRRLAELPEAERLAIHVFYLEGQNAAVAAEKLELSRSGFYALLQRALAHLATRPQTAPRSEATT
jgi:RNA polymerase sigma-70 factor (ECF subfamily)